MVIDKRRIERKEGRMGRLVSRIVSYPDINGGGLLIPQIANWPLVEENPLSEVNLSIDLKENLGRILKETGLPLLFAHLYLDSSLGKELSDLRVDSPKILFSVVGPNGVGKSLVTAALSIAMARQTGFSSPIPILDLDPFSEIGAEFYRSELLRGKGLGDIGLDKMIDYLVEMAFSDEVQKARRERKVDTPKTLRQTLINFVPQLVETESPIVLVDTPGVVDYPRAKGFNYRNVYRVVGSQSAETYLRVMKMFWWREEELFFFYRQKNFVTGELDAKPTWVFPFSAVEDPLVFPEGLEESKGVQKVRLLELIAKMEIALSEIVEAGRDVKEKFIEEWGVS
ncbi:hypothetical protein DRH14_00755 [Candidatus Shapirobacteria bacterium]|nr:MAG: hypothetical protein DRH14_00755 [Candidatus Shapirobacteria bacterium]